MATLEQLGWNDFHQKSQFNINQRSNQQGHEPARVTSVRGFRYHLVSERGEHEAELSGKLLYSTEATDLPAVGDWVEFIDYGNLAVIVSVLPRNTELSRKRPGTTTGKQLIAANVDVALITQGLDQNFNVMRLDRYIVQVQACRIMPVIVLNKSDLISSTEPFIQAVQTLGRNIPVYFVSATTGMGISELLSDLSPRKTYVLIGSSGAGKSSILNALTGSTGQKTNTLSIANEKGRHTTTRRDLFLLPGGSIFIDTPGMREFGLTADESTGTHGSFPEIDRIAADCRYSDCRHEGEPGCAVLDALNSGELSHQAYASWLKLVKEQRRFQVSAEERKRMNRSFGKMAREGKVFRKRNKY